MGPKTASWRRCCRAILRPVRILSRYTARTSRRSRIWFSMIVGSCASPCDARFVLDGAASTAISLTFVLGRVITRKPIGQPEQHENRGDQEPGVKQASRKLVDGKAYSGARMQYPAPRTVWISSVRDPLSILVRRRLRCDSTTLVRGSK